MSGFGTRLYTWLKGQLVGTDQFGNRYYRERAPRSLKRGGGIESRERRWVLYNGEVEASRVPPEWHGRLHHTVDEPPRPGGPKTNNSGEGHLTLLTRTAVP